MNLRSLYLGFFIAALFLTVPQCSKPESESPGGSTESEDSSAPKKYLSLSLESKSVDNETGSFELNVTTNCPWKALCSETWLSTSKSEGTRGEVIKVNYEANTQAGTRVATVTFTADGLADAIVTVTQSGKFIEWVKTEKEVDNAGAAVDVKIASNCDWTVESDQPWAVPRVSSGNSDMTISIDCSANPDLQGKRVAMITLSTSGLEPKYLKVTQGVTFTNPIGGVPDPYIVKDGSSYYLVKAATGINISRSDKLSHLNSTREVWRPDINSTTAWNTSHIWAPEMFKIDGKWYVYYTAGRPSSELNGSYKHQRSGVLRAKTDDPLGEWEDMGMLYTGDKYVDGIKAEVSNTNYAIDLTVFTLRGQLYAVWSGGPGSNDYNQSIYIAKMSNPYTISSNRVHLSSSDQVWEFASNPSRIQEGPAILQRNGKIFIVYSCNGSWTKYYRLAYLVMDENADPMVKENWTKSPNAIFYRCDDTSVDAQSHGVNGVGHCTFTVSPDGTEDWIVYHAKNRNDASYTTGRSSYIKRFTWNEDGTPNFGDPVAYGERSIVPSGE